MKEISALDLRQKFGEILDDVRYGKEPYIIKKNGRQIVVLMDIGLYQASQERFKEEAFIEEYTDARVKEFLEEDQLDRSSIEKIKKEF